MGLLTLLSRRRGGIPRANLLAEYRLNEGAGQYAYNRASGVGTLANLLPELAWTGYWNQTGTTRTVNAGTDPDGGDNALRVQAAGNMFLSLDSMALAAGTYTFSMWVKSNTGVNQDFRADMSGLSSYTTFTATPTWQRIALTQTLAASSNTRQILRSLASPVALDLLIYGAQLEAGSSATAFVPGRGDLFLGLTGGADTTDPTWANGGLHFTATARVAQGRLAAPRTLAALTAYAVVRWSNAAWANDAPVIGSDYNNTWTLAAAEQRTSAPWPLARAVTTANTTGAYAVNLNDNAWHVLAMTYDGVALSIYVDGILGSTLLLTGTANWRNIFLGWWSLNADGFPGDIADTDIYLAAHTQAQVIATGRALKTRAARKGIAIPAIDKLVVIEGDSISSFNSYAALTLRGLAAPRPLGGIYAYPGSRVNTNQAGIVTVAGRVAAVGALYDPTRSKNIYSLYVGVNDLTADGDSAATLYAEIKAVCQAIKAIGFRVLVGTILPTTSNPQGDVPTRQLATNVLLRNAISEGWADAIFDFAADATMGPQAAASNTSLYSDGIHPTATAHATYLQPIWSAALATLGIS